jgi:hypothetical protein
MHHKITHAMVGIVAAAFLIAAALFGVVTLLNQPEVEAAQVARRPVIPLIAHPVNDEMSACASCHVVGEGGMPASHNTYSEATCLTCHAVASAEELAAREAARAEEAAASQAEQGQTPAPGAATAIPHPVGAAYENCVGCHAIGSNRGMPENHAGYTNEMCVQCHAAVGAESPASGEAAQSAGIGGVGPLVPHDIDGQFVNCDSCHAFTMGRLAMPENHAGFTKDICANCHKPAE